MKINTISSLFSTSLVGLLLVGCAQTPPKQVSQDDKIKFISALVSAVKLDRIGDVGYVASNLDITLTKRSERYDWSEGMTANSYWVNDRFGRLSPESDYSNLSNKEITVDHFWGFTPKKDFCLTKKDIRIADAAGDFRYYGIMVSMSSGDDYLTFMFKDGDFCSYSITATKYRKKIAK